MGDIWYKIDKDAPYPERVLALVRNVGMVLIIIASLTGFAADIFGHQRNGFSLGAVMAVAVYGLLTCTLMVLHWFLDRQIKR
ncbi:hypothetical protein [Deinococcus sp.]|uniref:hypothetical protein n=1 Tax=Deinococcus sp. TaxID=47478 RepID=UPI0025C04959|nr:hypothetical protein [Deinococcus sp.]